MYRTDLALENIEIKKEMGVNPGEKDGIIMEKDIIDNIKITSIEIVNPKGEILLGKPMGNYITIETEPVIMWEDSNEEQAAQAISKVLSRFIKFHYYLKVLVVGLGNRLVTPDSLGPKTMDEVKITRHLFKMYDCDGDEEMSQVSGIVPGVVATTGIESADLIMKAVELSQCEVVIVIDALAARNVERVNNTIQISDAGISPGAGMGNYRRHIDEETLGRKVISIGVPTVIDSKNLIIDAMKEAGTSQEKIEKYIKERNFDMVVASTDIDVITEKFSKVLAKGINITLHPGIY